MRADSACHTNGDSRKTLLFGAENSGYVEEDVVARVEKIQEGDNFGSTLPNARLDPFGDGGSLHFEERKLDDPKPASPLKIARETLYFSPSLAGPTAMTYEENGSHVCNYSAASSPAGAVS